jgi:RNA recognition motif-containing protein
VEFETVDMAQTAIDKLNDTSLDNRLIFVREDREPEKPTTPTAVFVSNVCFNHVNAFYNLLSTFSLQKLTGFDTIECSFRGVPTGVTSRSFSLPLVLLFVLTPILHPMERARELVL